MQVTLLGLVLVPLSLVWALQPNRLLYLALIAAVFEAAAALVIGGSFGLQPAMLPGLLFITYVVAQYAVGMRYPGESPVFWTMFPMLALLSYALFSAWEMPNAFAGRVMVWPQRADALSPDFVPLQFAFGNITQSLYLTIDVLFSVSVALFLTRAAVPYDSIIAAYMTGGYIVVGLVFWQFVPVPL